MELTRLGIDLDMMGHKIWQKLFNIYVKHGILTEMWDITWDRGEIMRACVHRQPFVFFWSVGYKGMTELVYNTPNAQHYIQVEVFPGEGRAVFTEVGGTGWLEDSRET